MRRSNKVNAKNKKLAAEYGLDFKYWRYNGRKGIYWYLFSKFVRLRDFDKYGTCISCGRKFRKWSDAQAGHYAPASDCGFALLFDERNVNGECPSCNHPLFSQGKLIPYRANLVKRYGEKWVKKLDKDYADKHKKQTKEWSQKEYHTKILELMKKLENET